MYTGTKDAPYIFGLRPTTRATQQQQQSQGGGSGRRLSTTGDRRLGFGEKSNIAPQEGNNNNTTFTGSRTRRRSSSSGPGSRGGSRSSSSRGATPNTSATTTATFAAIAGGTAGSDSDYSPRRNMFSSPLPKPPSAEGPIISQKRPSARQGHVALDLFADNKKERTSATSSRTILGSASTSDHIHHCQSQRGQSSRIPQINPSRGASGSSRFLPMPPRPRNELGVGCGGGDTAAAAAVLSSSTTAQSARGVSEGSGIAATPATSTSTTPTSSHVTTAASNTPKATSNFMVSFTRGAWRTVSEPVSRMASAAREEEKRQQQLLLPQGEQQQQQQVVVSLIKRRRTEEKAVDVEEDEFDWETEVKNLSRSSQPPDQKAKKSCKESRDSSFKKVINDPTTTTTSSSSSRQDQLPMMMMSGGGSSSAWHDKYQNSPSNLPATSRQKSGESGKEGGGVNDSSTISLPGFFLKNSDDKVRRKIQQQRQSSGPSSLSHNLLTNASSSDTATLGATLMNTSDKSKTTEIYHKEALLMSDQDLLGFATFPTKRQSRNEGTEGNLHGGGGCIPLVVDDWIAGELSSSDGGRTTTTTPSNVTTDSDGGRTIGGGCNSVRSTSSGITSALGAFSKNGKQQPSLLLDDDNEQSAATLDPVPVGCRRGSAQSVTNSSSNSSHTGGHTMRRSRRLMKVMPTIPLVGVSAEAPDVSVLMMSGGCCAARGQRRSSSSSSSQQPPNKRSASEDLDVGILGLSSSDRMATDANITSTTPALSISVIPRRKREEGATTTTASSQSIL